MHARLSQFALSKPEAQVRITIAALSNRPFNAIMVRTVAHEHFAPRRYRGGAHWERVSGANDGAKTAAMTASAVNPRLRIATNHCTKPRSNAILRGRALSHMSVECINVAWCGVECGEVECGGVAWCAPLMRAYVSAMRSTYMSARACQSMCASQAVNRSIF